MGTVETVAVTFVIVVICALFLFMVYVLSKKEDQRDAAKKTQAEKAKDDDYDEEYYNPGATAEEMVRKHFEVAYYDLLKHLVFRDWEKVLKVLVMKCMLFKLAQ